MSAEMLPVDLVIVGAGPAGTRCAERGLRVTLLGAEPELPDNRVALSQLLAGDRAEAEFITHDAAALQQLRITYRSGVPITRSIRPAMQQGLGPRRHELAGGGDPAVAMARLRLRAAAAGGAWLTLEDPVALVFRAAQLHDGVLQACVALGPDHRPPERD